MNLHDGKARLCYAAQKLRLHWDDAHHQWNDAVSRDFQRDRLEPFEPLVAGTVRAIDRLAELVARVQQECGEAVDGRQ